MSFLSWDTYRLGKDCSESSESVNGLCWHHSVCKQWPTFQLLPQLLVQIYSETTNIAAEQCSDYLLAPVLHSCNPSRNKHRKVNLTGKDLRAQMQSVHTRVQISFRLRSQRSPDALLLTVPAVINKPANVTQHFPLPIWLSNSSLCLMQWKEINRNCCSAQYTFLCWLAKYGGKLRMLNRFLINGIFL